MAPNKDNKPIEKPPGNNEIRQIYRVAGYAFLLNLLLAVMKTFLAIFSGSLAITASAIDSGTDAIASLFIYGGVKLSDLTYERIELNPWYMLERVILAKRC